MTRTDDTLTVDSRDGTLRLDRWFKRHYPALGHGQPGTLLRTGRIRVDCTPARGPRDGHGGEGDSCSGPDGAAGALLALTVGERAPPKIHWFLCGRGAPTAKGPHRPAACEDAGARRRTRQSPYRGGAHSRYL